MKAADAGRPTGIDSIRVNIATDFVLISMVVPLM